jgi:hypothetical protein
MTAQKALLTNLLRLLVQEWGRETVRAELAKLTQESTGIDDGGVGATVATRARIKLLAIEQVERAKLPDAQAAALRELAVRFDRKQFLPSLSDVREFLIMMGERPGAIKDRPSAFRLLLLALAALPAERLERLTHSARHSGPSQLGPLSDAISSAAASLPRHRGTGS